MRARIYWIDDDGVRLGIMPRPRGGDYLDDEIASLCQQGVEVLVSLLTAEEAEELDLTREAQACRDCSLRFVSFPIPDREMPEDKAATRLLVDDLRSTLEQGRGVGIHCRAGIGRSALIAAAVLGARGVSPEEALRKIGAARGCEVPDTPEQRQWVERFAAKG